MNRNNKIIIWGASGHASVVADIINLNDEYKIIGFLDDINKENYGSVFCGSKILGGREKLKLLFKEGVRNIIIAIGDCDARVNLSNFAVKEGFSLTNAIHPNSVIAKNVILGQGVAIMAGVVINSGSKIGNNVIINTSSSVDHDCIIEDGSHVCPGVHLAGSVKIGKGTWIGVGSIIKDKIKIGNQTIIGAGSVVLADIPSKVTAFGVPAKIRINK